MVVDVAGCPIGPFVRLRLPFPASDEQTNNMIDGVDRHLLLLLLINCAGSLSSSSSVQVLHYLHRWSGSIPVTPLVVVGGLSVDGRVVPSYPTAFGSIESTCVAKLSPKCPRCEALSALCPSDPSRARKRLYIYLSPLQVLKV